MRRARQTLAIVIGYLLAIAWLAAQEGFVLTGRLSATDQEADEGYFAIDQQTMVVAKPGSELHAYLRGQAGKRVRLTVTPAPEPK
jgi:hypothetical protein